MKTPENRPSWSKTQVEMLRECERKLILSARAMPPDSPPDVPPVLKEAGRLKKIKNRYLWFGALLHETIGTLLKTLRQGVPVPPLETTIEEMRERMRKEFRESKTAGAVERLFEHEYGIPVPAEAWKRQWEAAENALRWFTQSSWFRRLKSLGPECWKTVDEVLDFDVNGIKAYVKIDCALEVQGRFILIDWKTSRVKPEDEASLGVAALYAHEVWGAEPSAIDALSVSLLNGERWHAHVTEDLLMETQLRIEEEAALLQTDLSASPADPLEVKKTENIETCLRCHFQRICYPGGLKYPGGDEA